MRSYEPYIPQTIGELDDLLGSMMLGAPKFVGTGFFAGRRNIDTEFISLTQGLAVIRPKLGEERYQRMIEMAEWMRVLFEADPDTKTGDTLAGCALISAIEDELRAARKPKAG